MWLCVMLHTSVDYDQSTITDRFKMSSLLIILTIFVKFSLNFQLDVMNSNNSKILINDWFKFNSDEQIVYATSSEPVEDIYGIFENHQPHIIYNFNQTNHQNTEWNQINYDYYIIIDANWNNVINTMTKLYINNNLNVHGKYLIIIQQLFNRNNITDIFNFIFKDADIYNVILMNNEILYTWYPYENDCNRNITIHQIDKMDLLKNFDKKLPKKLNNCELRVAHNDGDSVALIPLIEQIGECINATITFITDDKLDPVRLGLKYGHLNNINYDMQIMNVTVILCLSNLNLQSSTFVFNDVYNILLLPPRRLVPKWKEFKVFSNQMLLFITITIIICGCVLSLLTKQPLVESFFRMYQLSLQLSLNLFPKQWRLRIYFMFLFLFIMVITAAYLCGLSRVFTKPSLEAPIKTLQQFFDSDIPLKTFARNIETLKSQVVEFKKKPWPKEKFIIKNWNETFENKSFSDNYAFVSVLIGPQDDILQHAQVLPIDPRQPVGFFYRQRLHLNNLIDYHIRNIDEKGLIAHYMNPSTQMSQLGLNKIVYENVIVLTVFDLSGVFIIWLLGLGFATVVFTYEIIHYKREMELMKLRRIQQQRQRKQCFV